MVDSRVLIVVPTLGQRLDHLRSCLTSIASQSVAVDITIVSPITPEIEQLAIEFNAQLISDPGSQTKAINAGVAHAATSTNYEFVNWLGDDDLLEPDSLATTTAALDANPAATVAYGACRYIDERDQELWVSSAGKWAPRVLGWGPDLIPQPGMLVRMHAWKSVGGVDESYRFAFDLDLLLKLKKLGPLVDTGTIVSSFRWHADSLTVGDRTTNLQESERAKRAALSPAGRKVAWIWERPVRGATRIAAWEVNRRAGRKKA
jgi:cellulose synthase/poly-beta-1,6-N-acetylglucosamine synthase-like glycosyltransferase